MEEGNIRVRTWDEFKSLVNEKKPGSIVFILEQSGFSPNKELTSLKLIMLHDRRYYIFIDSPKGNTEVLRGTGIPFHKDKYGILNLDEDEVKAFLEKQFIKDNVKVFSFWTY